MNVRKWTLESCKEISKKFKTPGEWSRECPLSFQAALNNKWYPSEFPHIQSTQKVWNFENCLAEALKHETRSDWAKASTTSYKAAKNKEESEGWFTLCTMHMVTRKRNKGERHESRTPC